MKTEETVGHTPGPWRVHANNEVFQDSLQICKVGGWSKSEMYANAQLIASSPDLLKENQELKADLKLVNESWNLDIKQVYELKALNAVLIEKLAALIDATEDKGGQFKAWHQHLRQTTQAAKETIKSIQL